MAKLVTVMVVIAIPQIKIYFCGLCRLFYFEFLACEYQLIIRRWRRSSSQNREYKM